MHMKYMLETINHIYIIRHSLYVHNSLACMVSVALYITWLQSACDFHLFPDAEDPVPHHIQNSTTQEICKPWHSQVCRHTECLQNCLRWQACVVTGEGSFIYFV